MGRPITQRINRWGGHNCDENPLALEPGEIHSEWNVYLRGQTLGTRPGLEHDGQYTSNFDPGTTDAIQGIVEVRSSFDDTRNLVVIADGKFYVIGQSGGSDTPTDVVGASGATITAGQNNLWTFAQHKGAVYAAGGKRASGSGDSTLVKWTVQDEGTATGSLNDISVIDISTTSGTYASGGLNVFQKWNRLWLNGFVGTDIDGNPMIGRYSALNDGDTWPQQNTVGGASAVGGFSAYGDEHATGWAEYEDNDGDWLLFLTNRRIYSVAQTGALYAPFAKTDNIGSGCVSQRAFVSLGVDSGDAVWMSDRGFHSARQSQQFGGREDKFLSWKIRDCISTLNPSRLRYASGAYWPTEGIVLFAVTTGSNTTHDLILCLDVKANGGRELTAEGARWYRWRLNTSYSANVVVPARDTDGTPYIYVGTAEGDVLRFTTTTNQDVSSGYEVLWTTRHNDLGVPGVTKFPMDLFLKLQPGGSYNPRMEVVYNYGERRSSSITLSMPTVSPQFGTAIFGTDRFGTTNDTFRQKVRAFGSGETIAFKFFHSGVNEPFYVADLAYQVAARGEDIGQVVGS